MRNRIAVIRQVAKLSGRRTDPFYIFGQDAKKRFAQTILLFIPQRPEAVVILVFASAKCKNILPLNSLIGIFIFVIIQCHPPEFCCESFQGVQYFVVLFNFFLHCSFGYAVNTVNISSSSSSVSVRYSPKAIMSATTPSIFSLLFPLSGFSLPPASR